MDYQAKFVVYHQAGHTFNDSDKALRLTISNAKEPLTASLHNLNSLLAESLEANSGVKAPL